jgi:hypothetical protein
MYYKAYFLHHQDCLSPNVDMFTMYQPYSHIASPPSASKVRATEVPLSHVTSCIDSEFKQVTGSIAATACSANGRSLLQAVMRTQDAENIAIILHEILGSIEQVALDNHGCHVLRSLVEILDDGQLRSLVDNFNETLVLNMCTLTQYTRRILQSLFERHIIDLHPIVEMMSKNAQYLAATQQGCISLMRIFEQCDQEQKNLLISPLLPMFVDLATDPFGNYVVQCVIQHSDRGMAARYAVECFSGQLLKMSCNKFASNVVEKIITNVNAPITRRIVLDELVYNPAALQQMVHDSFGNFVIQSIIETCTNLNEFKRVCDRLRPALPGSPFGHKIESRIRSKKQFQSTHPRFQNNLTPTPQLLKPAIAAAAGY